MATKKKKTAAEQAAETVNVAENEDRDQQTADVQTEEQESVEAVEQSGADTTEHVSDLAETEGKSASDSIPTEAPAEKKPERTKKEKKRQMVTLTAKMNIRDNPTLEGKILTTKPRGTELEVISTKGNWLEVDMDGKSAFVLYQKGKYGVLS